MEFDGGQAEHAVDGAGVDVDELESAVGHDGGAVEHDPAADEQVVLTFGIADGAGLAEDDDRRDDAVRQDGDPDHVQPGHLGGEDDREDQGVDEQRDEQRQ